MKNLLLFTITILLLWGCQSFRNKQQLKAELNQFLNTKIFFPESLTPFSFEDTIRSSELLGKPIKMIIYIKPSGCNECRIRTLKQKLVPFLQATRQYPLNTIIIFNTADIQTIKNTMNEYELKLPYYLDPDTSFLKKNTQITLSPLFETFLTINDAIILAGDPTSTPRLSDLYIQEIIKRAK